MVLSAFCKFFVKSARIFCYLRGLQCLKSASIFQTMANCACAKRGKCEKTAEKRMPGLILHGGCDTILIDVAVCPPLMNGKNL